MPENVYTCPFSHRECRNCPIYRGRHSYITIKDSDGTPQPRILKKPDDWQAKFKAVVRNREDDISRVKEAEQLKQHETDAQGDGKERKEYKIKLTVLDAETGETITCTVAEASTWDWGNWQKVRAIGPWHIYSFERLLAILAQKAESGCEEIDMTEAPFHAGR